MKVKFIKSTWGMTEASLAESVQRIKEGGYWSVYL